MLVKETAGIEPATSRYHTGTLPIELYLSNEVVLLQKFRKSFPLQNASLLHSFRCHPNHILETSAYPPTRYLYLMESALG